jgi:hypothetical protein
VAPPPSPEQALASACAQAGLNADGAQVIYQRANAVYRLGNPPVVARLRYAPGSSAVLARLSASVRVTGWLNSINFPAVNPLDVPQPVTTDGYIVTFWHYLPAIEQPPSDIAGLAQLLRRLHELPLPSIDLPVTNPLGSLVEDVRRCQWLTGTQRSWLLEQCEELQRQYAETTWTLGCGLIHGDAYTDNLIHTRDRVVLADWDSVGYAPREQDIVPTSIRYRFGLPASEWDQFCDAYGIDPNRLEGLPVLQRMRELRTLTPYVRTRDHAQAQAEVTRRIADLMNGTQDQPWQALNLAS